MISQVCTHMMWKGSAYPKLFLFQSCRNKKCYYCTRSPLLCDCSLSSLKLHISLLGEALLSFQFETETKSRPLTVVFYNQEYQKIYPALFSSILRICSVKNIVKTLLSASRLGRRPHSSAECTRGTRAHPRGGPGGIFAKCLLNFGLRPDSQ